MNKGVTITKDYVEKMKEEGKLPFLIHQSEHNSRDLLFILDKCGKLPDGFNLDEFLYLLKHENEKVRTIMVKLLGRRKSDSYLDVFMNIAKNDESTIVRREAVSSIGRMRINSAQPFLIEMLEDKDPKVVGQAIRGLLVFKKNDFVANALKKLSNHENETIRATIDKEFFSDKTKCKSIQKHTEIYPYLKNVVVNGNVIDVLKLVPDESIHLTFTSPPYYNARDYSIYPSYDAYLEFLRKVFLETYRITKEGRFLIVNTSPVIVPRISRAHSSKRYPIPFDIHHDLVNMGWDFIDDIIWKKPEYSVKNRIGGFHQHRKPLGYKPNNVTEYLMVYRKHTDKLIDWNMKQYPANIIEKSLVLGDYESTNVWEINPKSDKIHSAIFPEDLCKRVIQYYSFVGDLVFDPFGGSGTCGRVAKCLDRYCFMTELDPNYFKYMQTLDKSNNLFSKGETKYLSVEQFKDSQK